MRPWSNKSEATIEGTRKDYLADLASVSLLIIDDLGMRKLPHTAAEDLLELVMRRYERASTILTSNRPVEDWGKLLGDTAAVTALLDRLLHHAHVLKCGPRSWRTKAHTDLHPQLWARVAFLEGELAARDRLIGDLQRTITEQRGQIERLTAVVEELQRAGKPQAAPLSKGQPKSHPAKPGRKPGARYGRRSGRAVPDRVDETYTTACPKQCSCGGAVAPVCLPLEPEPQSALELPATSGPSQRSRARSGTSASPSARSPRRPRAAEPAAPASGRLARRAAAGPARRRTPSAPETAATMVSSGAGTPPSRSKS
jgi:uncharacterized coiled-coil protein SlyX